jgi:glutaminyl-tRNA synthetase
MKALQLDAAIVFFKDNNGEDFDVELFKKSCGIGTLLRWVFVYLIFAPFSPSNVGVFPTQADIEAALDAIFKEKADEIAEKRYHSMPTINHVAREKIPFGDRKVIVDVINAKLAATLGPKTDADKAPPKAAAKAPKAKPAEVRDFVWSHPVHLAN